MDKLQAKERIEYLKKEIVENSKLYYECDSPNISDFEYDMMFQGALRA
jgi:DNA ligase (NAD+)